ncbi:MULTISPECIES: phosphatidylinositol mannoside acyltransferase [Gordonia]|uniref:Phosphatidylinositol mannoside acyltransferase n=2 Tax=Gordonia TaxID=2053 RepID=A0ABN3HKN2_9ACTN|nr:lipid A biosynthesis lauroyl acyltransferase [Gordonia sihwensis]KXT55764.1 lipid A biosynthesis lauroyl acyltransferase [Gordonia sp. QH-12]MBY4571643.1 phosphatidylinositol mannoside acyltransferase [Gordonia sihwensis]GAC60979.1 putative acyltransferase [Gordonia sihwensis NBRC 108236]
MIVLDKLAEYASDFGYRAGWAAVRWAPESVARSVFDAVGTVAGRRGGGPEQLRKNLARVVGTTPEQVPDALVEQAMRSYARYWREAFRLPTTDPADIVASVRMSDHDRRVVDEVCTSGKGVVMALPHSGNWDICGVWLVAHYGQFATVAERLKPESLFDQFVAYRESLGFEVFPLTGGEQPPFRLLADRLRAGGIVCLMSDRDLSHSGVPVELFGERTRMPAGPAKLAIETGATLLAVHHSYPDADTSLIRCGTVIDTSGGVAAATQALADAFAEGIASAPADWHMLQPLWESDWSQARRDRLGVDGE